MLPTLDQENHSSSFSPWMTPHRLAQPLGYLGHLRLMGKGMSYGIVDNESAQTIPLYICT
jgi:hypothetical protein